MARRREPARSGRLNMRLADDKLERWREFAEADGRSLTDFVERCVDDVIAVLVVNRRHDQSADRRARRLGELSPTRIEELRERGGDGRIGPSSTRRRGCEPGPVCGNVTRR